MAWVAGILIASIVLQLAAAAAAMLQVGHASRFRFAWVCMSLALLLMVERGVEPLLMLQADQEPRWVNHVTGLLISMLMAAGVFGLRSLFRTLRRQDELLKQLSATDPLTGLVNRRALNDCAQREMRLSQRTGKTLSVLMIDLDYFKQINDRFGHSVGDAVLVRVAEKLRISLRNVDHIGRWGGEEFVALLPDVDTEGAMRVAERVRREIGEEMKDEVKTTVSIGVTAYRPEQQTHGDMWPVLIDQADCALYCAKQEGRNCTRLYDPRGAAEAYVAAAGGLRACEKS
jgi:diguanylate cyclase (GGDEF)-like protein